jgi:hypothetical protein
MADLKAYVEPPKSQKPWIQGFKDYVEKHFGNFSFKEVRYIHPETSIYDSIAEMEKNLGKLQEGEELGGCCARLPTGEVVIYLVNKHKQGYERPFYGLLFEMIHLAKPEWNGEKVEQETSKHFDSAMEYARIFAYNVTHKRKKKPYPKQTIKN